jgi:hypothetical protein
MRVARWLLLGLGGLVLAIALALGVWALLPAATPPLEGPGPIAALERVVLGGAEQTLLVRGRDRGKPALLSSGSRGSGTSRRSKPPSRSSAR